jgi:uncharacterized protein (TIGR02996 family)
MTPEDAFLLDILIHPDEAAPRLIYADWLEDQGDPRSPWVRQGCEVLAAPANSPERRVAREKFRSACAEEGHTWPELEGLVLTWAGLVSVFRYRLAEVFAWCRGRGLPLRSSELHPAVAFERSVDPGSRDVAWPEGKEGWGTLVQSVALWRSQALAGLGLSPHSLAEDLAGGRLLVYVPDAAPSQALARRPGTDYLDGSLVPGWDTWLVYGREAPPEHPHWLEHYIVAWVPPHLVAEVQRDMAAHPGRWLAWAEEFDRPFLRTLRSAGLID